MNPIMKQIKAKLGDEIKSYRELLELVQEEKEILLSGKHDKLFETSERKLALSGRLSIQQKERRRLMDALAPSKGEPARLRDLEPHMPPEERGEFRQIAHTLATLAKRLAGLNELNRQYIQEALDTVEHLLNIMTGHRRKESYGRKGKAEQGPSLPRLVTREV